MQKKLVGLWLLILSISLVYAQNITLDYPKSVEVGEEFEIEVFLLDFEPGNYDIKFEILEGNKNIAQRYWEDAWKSTHYWIKDGFSEGDINKEFSLKIVGKYKGEKMFKIKLRDATDTWIFDGYVFEIEPMNEEKKEKKEANEKEEDTRKKEMEKNEDEIKENKIESELGEEKGIDDDKPTSYKIENLSVPIIEDKIISLGPKKIKKETSEIIYVSKQENVRKYAFFAFALGCIVFSLLVIWKKI